MTDEKQVTPEAFRERLSSNAEDFDRIVADMLAALEAVQAERDKALEQAEQFRLQMYQYANTAADYLEALERNMRNRGTNHYGDPDGVMLADPVFNAVWNEIKSWDINVPEEYEGYCGATGNHAAAIVRAIRAIEQPEPDPNTCDHKWIDVTNEVFQDTEQCERCLALRAAGDDSLVSMVTVGNDEQSEE